MKPGLVKHNYKYYKRKQGQDGKQWTHPLTTIQFPNSFIRPFESLATETAISEQYTVVNTGY